MFLALICSTSAWAQTPEPPPPPPPEPPPPLVEFSAQAAFLGTTGNASTQSLGAGGEWIYRPDPWEYNAKAIFAQLETDDDLTARSFASLFRASKKLNDRLSAYGQYDFLLEASPQPFVHAPLLFRRLISRRRVATRGDWDINAANWRRFGTNI